MGPDTPGGEGPLPVSARYSQERLRSLLFRHTTLYLPPRTPLPNGDGEAGLCLASGNRRNWRRVRGHLGALRFHHL